MAKILKYKNQSREVILGWNEKNEEIAKREADGGIYSIEDVFVMPTLEERTSALEAALLEMMGVTPDG